MTSAASKSASVSKKVAAFNTEVGAGLKRSSLHENKVIAMINILSFLICFVMFFIFIFIKIEHLGLLTLFGLLENHLSGRVKYSKS